MQNKVQANCKNIIWIFQHKTSDFKCWECKQIIEGKYFLKNGGMSTKFKCKNEILLEK